MNRANCFAVRALVLVAAVMFAAAPKADERPNIVLIVADDVGFSDIGAYGSEIRTPHIDALAGNGIQLTNFRAAPTCGPSRTMMLTGVDHHRIGAGINRAGHFRLPQLRDRPGYEGYLNDRAVTFATVLRDAGYQTLMTGKWDPGREPGRLASDRGFVRSFVLAAGGASHFADATGTFRPTAVAHYFEDGREVEKLPADFYSSRFYTDKMIEYIDGAADDSPYLAYVAYTAPHWPLQVPDDWLDRYAGRYAGGWQELRQERFARLLELGVLPRHTQLSAQNRAVPQWDDLSAQQQAVEARRMEIYAAMIENMDFHIGRLLQHVNARETTRDTVIIFLSDNGAEGNAVHLIIGNDEWVPQRFDNSLENMGRINSYVWQGVGWAHASVTPFRIYKSYTTAGGIRTPAIVASTKGRFASGKRDGTVTVRDIMPTLLDLAGVPLPSGTYDGRDILPITGRSALAYLDGKADTVHGDAALGWEVYGSRALLKGEWKAVRIFPPEGSGEWTLFNVRTDPAETTDLAEDYADVLNELSADWDQYAIENGIAVFEEDIGYGRYPSP